jgi:hypothetical protein
LCRQDRVAQVQLHVTAWTPCSSYIVMVQSFLSENKRTYVFGIAASSEIFREKCPVFHS